MRQEIYFYSKALGKHVSGSYLRKGWHLNECPNETQQCLLFGSISETQELTQLDMAPATARRGIGLVNDESAAVAWLPPKKP